jgi:hypothetical protein
MDATRRPGEFPPCFPEAATLVLPRTRRLSSLVRRRPAAVLLTLSLLSGAARAATDFHVFPQSVTLQGNYAQAQLVVTARTGAGPERSADLTRAAVYAATDPRVVSVTKTGRLLARADGTAAVTVRAGGVTHSVPVKVTGVKPHPTISYTAQVMPVIAKAGCNAGACHASQFGKGGFKLSVFGFDPPQDHFNIVRDAFGRRVNLVEPERSLFLLKPTAAVPHGGGPRFRPGSVDYQVLRSWLACGAPGPEANAPGVTALKVTPSRRVGEPGFIQQLRVVAVSAGGAERDVTAWAKFDSMDDGVLRVSPDGLVEAVGRGQGTVMVRFQGQAQIAQVIVPYTGRADQSGWVSNNYVDELAAAKFRELGISPSPLCDDATFLRRAYLDAVGTLPSVAETTAFLDSRDPAKRNHLVDRLLGLTGAPDQDVHNNDYAAYWALKWSDLLRSNSTALGEQGMWALHNWLQTSFRENKRFDRVARELLTAKGTTYDYGPANFFVVFNTVDAETEAAAQVFLGVRLQCARCHHHPFETISQADYYRFAAFFARVSTKTAAHYGKLGGPRVILVSARGEVAHPRTGQIMPPTPLGGKPIPADLPDRRQGLADWLTARDNPYFARNVVNRYVAYLLGRGLVEPIDDLRATNPPSNVELMNALAPDFVKHGYDVKRLMRTLMTSRLYQLDSTPTRSNARDRRYYSHYFVKHVPAEPLLDAVDRLTGVPTKFEKVPLGTRAIELPDAVYTSYFLKTFGKPKREGVCECERVSDPNLAQALHTLNSERIEDKIGSPTGRIARLLAAKKPHEEIVAELYLAALCRRPTAAEQAACRKLLAQAPMPRAFYEDLLWSLINSKHFLFVR